MAPRKKADVIVSQSEITSFENTKQLFIELADQVTQIKVTDTTSLAIANQKMSNVYNHLKEIEAKRAALKKACRKEVHVISAVARTGVEAVLNLMATKIKGG